MESKIVFPKVLLPCLLRAESGPQTLREDAHTLARLVTAEVESLFAITVATTAAEPIRLLVPTVWRTQPMDWSSWRRNVLGEVRIGMGKFLITFLPN